MSPEQVARVLAAAAARDNRTVGTADIRAWAEDIGDLDPEDALAAVSRHYRTSTDRLMPVHVRRLVIEIAEERRRAELRAQVDRAAAELGPEPQRRLRSPEVHRLIAQLRQSLPAADPAKVRRPEPLTWDRANERRHRAEPNPHYDPEMAAAHHVPQPPSEVEASKRATMSVYSDAAEYIRDGGATITIDHGSQADASDLAAALFDQVDKWVIARLAMPSGFLLAAEAFADAILGEEPQ
jgi:hypothetical protein